MKPITILIITICSLQVHAQPDFNRIIDNFSNIQDMPYMCTGHIDEVPWSPGCGDSIFWDALSYKEAIIPHLLDRLDDTTPSEAYVPNFGGIYTVGDISLVALKMLIWAIPVRDFVITLDDLEEEYGNWEYWDYIRERTENRAKFKNWMNSWYNVNKDKFVWVESDIISECECGVLNNPAGGHFIVDNSYAVFIGTVKSIERENWKEGAFDAIRFKVDSIIQYDEKVSANFKIYLNKKRKNAVLMDSPTKHNFEVGLKYLVYANCCNVDYYYSNPYLTSEYNKQHRQNDCSHYIDSLTNRKVYTFVDQMPEFDNPKGFLASLMSILTADSVSEVHDTKGTVEFVVEMDGSTSNIKITNPIHKQIDKQIVQFVKENKWKQGYCNKLPVPVKLIIPYHIDFR